MLIVAVIVVVLLGCQALGWEAKLGPVTVQPGWVGLAIWSVVSLWPG